MVHVDYTSSSGIDRLDALLPDEAAKLRETPFAVIQVRMTLERKLPSLTSLIRSLLNAAVTATSKPPLVAYCVVSFEAV